MFETLTFSYRSGTRVLLDGTVHTLEMSDDLSDSEIRHLLTFNPPSLRHTPIMTAMRSSFTSQSPAWMAANIKGTFS